MSEKPELVGSIELAPPNFHAEREEEVDDTSCPIPTCRIAGRHSHMHTEFPCCALPVSDPTCPRAECAGAGVINKMGGIICARCRRILAYR